MRMRCLLLASVVGGVCIGAPVTFAGADLNVGDLIKFTDLEGTTGGGEFGIRKGPTFSTVAFRTFCVQTSEFLNFSDTFKIGNIGTSSIVLTPHVLEPETAFLYTQFRAGTLVGYDYTANTAEHISDANDLQRAIWELQGQSGGAQNAYYKYAKDAVDLDSTVRSGNIYGDTNLWNNGVSDFGFGNVRIANVLFASNNANAQDQLVLVPTPQASLAGISLLAGIGCINYLRKRRDASREI